jgi:hypothetical protein
MLQKNQYKSKNNFFKKISIFMNINNWIILNM